MITVDQQYQLVPIYISNNFQSHRFHLKQVSEIKILKTDFLDFFSFADFKKSLFVETKQFTIV